MIFVQAATEPTMFLMLAENDVQTMRDGRTLFVGPQQMQGHHFNKVILSLHHTNDHALETLRLAGHDVSKHAPEAVPEPGEGRCDECKGCISTPLLFEGKCTVCWATIAKKLQTQCG
jgi:hypothetical protein